MQVPARILLGLILPLVAAAGTSANYTLEPTTLDSGGLAGSSTNYALNFSNVSGGVGSSANYTSRSGFAGQLMDAVGVDINRDSATLTLDERATRQLVPALVFDDQTASILSSTEVTWSVVSGALANVSSSGLATGATVYQNSSGIVRAVYSTLSGTRELSVLNVGNDDFGTYAADGLSDLWQVQNFGENSANAGPAWDGDADGLSNLLEFAFGTNPSVGSGSSVAWSPGLLPGTPTHSISTTSGNLTFRAVFARRRDYLAAGLTYTVEFSADLLTWKASTAIPAMLVQNSEIQVVSVPYPFFVNGKKARFFRVGVKTPYSL
jgi:hypothetical protein